MIYVLYAFLWILSGIPGYLSCRSTYRRSGWCWTVKDRNEHIWIAIIGGLVSTMIFLIGNWDLGGNGNPNRPSKW